MTALLFCDFETTSLRPRSATCLEAAWAVTDITGTQRSRMRSRFVELTPGEARPVLPEWRGQPRSVHWSNHNVADAVALRMAVDSGLAADWIAAPRRTRIGVGAELARLMLDDLGHAVAEGETVHLAGAGVARFDWQLLQQHCPAVIEALHYRPVDVSVAVTALAGCNRADDVIWQYLADGGPGEVELADAPYCTLDRDEDQVRGWLVGGAEPHRAAPDVARAMVTQRALWLHGAPLRGWGVEPNPQE